MNWAVFGQTIDTLKASVERMIYNAGTMFAFFAQYVSSVPQDATWSYRKEDGTIENKSVPNTVKFRNALWDDVGGALGQFNRTFYVDAVNGSDTNDGSSGSPFATLSKAVASIPAGGHASISIVSDITITKNIYVVHKAVEIKVIDSVVTVIPYLDNGYFHLPGLLARSSTLHIYLYNSKIAVSPKIGSENYYWKTGVFSSSRFSNSVSIFLNNSEIELSEDGQSLIKLDDFTPSIQDVAITVYGEESRVNINYGYLVCNAGYTPLKFNFIRTIGTAEVDVSKLIKYIKRDPDIGNPLNVISNIEL